MKNSKTGIIYAYTNLQSGKMYIGQTINPRKRFLRHLTEKFKNGWHVDYQRNPEKYEYSIIETDVPEDKLDEREIFWIRFFDSYRNGYNLTEGGGGQYGRTRDKHPMTGKHHSEETKAKISQGNRGKKHTEDAKRKMSWIAKNRKPISDETRKKLSIAAKRNLTEERKQLLIQANLGKHHTAEHKAKISEKLRGVVRSENFKDGVSKQFAGTRWYNNGIVNKRCKDCPEGFVPGKLKTLKN